MKALVKKEAAEGLWLEDVPEPEIGINDVLIKIKRTAICGTDLHIYNWDAWAQKTIPVPMVVDRSCRGRGTWSAAAVATVWRGAVTSVPIPAVSGSTGPAHLLSTWHCQCPMSGNTVRVSTWMWRLCSTPSAMRFTRP